MNKILKTIIAIPIIALLVVFGIVLVAIALSFVAVFLLLAAFLVLFIVLLHKLFKKKKLADSEDRIRIGGRTYTQRW